MEYLKEDFERVHLTDEVYIKEMEMQEKEWLASQKPPAKIKLKIKKSKRCKSLNIKKLEK